MYLINPPCRNKLNILMYFSPNFISFLYFKTKQKLDYVYDLLMFTQNVSPYILYITKKYL